MTHIFAATKWGKLDMKLNGKKYQVVTIGRSFSSSSVFISASKQNI